MGAPHFIQRLPRPLDQSETISLSLSLDLVIMESSPRHGWPTLIILLSYEEDHDYLVHTFIIYNEHLGFSDTTIMNYCFPASCDFNPEMQWKFSCNDFTK